jgi:hypothetical protein
MFGLVWSKANIGWFSLMINMSKDIIGMNKLCIVIFNLILSTS